MMIVAGVTISEFLGSRRFNFFNQKKFKIIIITLTILLAIFSCVFVVKYRNNRIIQLKINEIEYSVGIIDKSEFYHRNKLGEFFEISNFINKNFLNDSIIDNWNAYGMFLKNGNRYVTLHDYFSTTSTVSWSAVCNYLQEKNYFLLAVDYSLREVIDKHLWIDNKGVDPMWEKIHDIEDVIALNSTVIFNKHNGRLYQIDSCGK
jgi:small-conductance mechanosensitive channel